MDIQKPPLLKTAMNYGAFTGGILIAFSVLTNLLSLGSTFGGYFALIVLAFCILYFTKTYRDKELNGFINYNQAMSLGVLIGIFASIILAFFLFLELKFIDPTLIQKQLDLMRDKMLQKGLSDEQVDKTIIMLKTFMTPAMTAFISILFYAFLSFIISLITSAIIKKEGSPFNDSKSNNEF